MPRDSSTNLIQVLEHAATFHGSTEIVSRLEEGSVHRISYDVVWQRVGRLANALKASGIDFGDRVGTIAWNSHRHVEAWYALAGIGAICHTINPRLFDDQLIYIIRHAADRMIMLDLSFVPLVERLQSQLTTVEQFVIFCGRDQLPSTSLRSAIDYESWIATENASVDWRMWPEDTPSTLCYTSGTTGCPKGVLYTHRTNLLHAAAIKGKEAIGISCRDSVLAAVPMYHANSWGLPYACPMAGAKLVFPGARQDSGELYDLVEGESCTLGVGVPTVWERLRLHAAENGKTFSSLREINAGGAPVSRRLVEGYQREHGITILQGWGMTELNPVGTICRLKPYMDGWSMEEQLAIRVKQGLPLFGMQLKLVDQDGKRVPHDGKACGRLLVRGPWVIDKYYLDESPVVDEDGWFDTGDVATIDVHGYLQITDRAKDLIKSGGEWISSVALESIVALHPAVRCAAAVAIDDPVWGERPFLWVERDAGSQLEEETLRHFLEQHMPRWWLPERIRFIDPIPLTGTGKINKLVLRQQAKDLVASEK